MIVVVMGVSGVGKSTIGRMLAHELGWRFIDADDHHPAQNVAKMRAGTPLQDEDRWPWLDRLNSLLREEKNAVIACSALKKSYRRRLTDRIEEHVIVFLHGTPELIRGRMASRQHRYMPASLLDSQFKTLEPPAPAIAVDVAVEPEACVASILQRLRSPPTERS